MVRIRLMRMGMKGQPSYRVVVADSRSPRDGRFIENIGWYNPLTDPSTIKIDAERAKYWLSKGAQPSESVDSLLRRAGIKERRTAEAGAAKDTSKGATTTATATPPIVNETPEE
jgi:small subunit ribosomal protein S16